MLRLIFLRVVALVKLRVGIHSTEWGDGLFKGATSTLRAFPPFPLHNGGLDKTLGGKGIVEAV